jgi:hypothetical protein
VVPVILPELAIMVVVPTATAVARPLLLIVATAGFDELQVTCEVRSFVVPSENVPVAANGWVAPILILGVGGEIDMEDRVADFTVRVVLPERLPEVAVMVVVPVVTGVARPLALTVATAGFDELQVTWEVRSWVVESENVPVAVNCWVACRIMLVSVGVTAIEDRVAEVTVRVVVPEILPEVAVMVVVPAATAVASPPLLAVATPGFDEFQATWEVISWVDVSEYVPVAVNCWVACRGMLGSVGVTDIEDRVPEVTVRVVLPTVLPRLAVMVAVPAARAVARPLLFTVATAELDEPQVTSEVILWVPPPAYVPVAKNCWVACTDMTGLAGAISMDFGASAPQANKHTANDPRNNIAETYRRIFMSTSLNKSGSPPAFSFAPGERNGPYPSEDKGLQRGNFFERVEFSSQNGSKPDDFYQSNSCPGPPAGTIPDASLSPPANPCEGKPPVAKSPKVVDRSHGNW